MRRVLILSLLLLATLAAPVVSTSSAEITPAQRRELIDLKKKVSRINVLVRRKKVDEAAPQLEEVESALQALIEAAGVEPDERTLQPLMKDIERVKASLARAMGDNPQKSEKITFIEHVAPLIDRKCLGCHGATNPRNGLRLDTLAGWRRGGQGGPLLAPGAAGRSLLIARLSAPAGQGQMPAQGEPLSREEIGAIATWINQGADISGMDPSMTLGDLIYEHEKETMAIEIPKPTGNETVSFTRDMAPWMANLCLGCHNSGRKSGGLSVETFYDLMKGGDTGLVILPGDMENSRFFRLVGGLELPRMPQGQARITRKNYEDMKQWFREGNTFDGADPRTNISTYVLTPAQMAAEEFRTKTDEEMLAHRRNETESQLKKAVPNDPQNFVDTEHFLMAGNVETQRLEEVGAWAEERLGDLQKMFGGSGQPWRGKLAIFVLKDRFSYDEFNEVVEQRRADQNMKGHTRVTASFEQAYAVIQDVGDEDSLELTTRKNLTEHLAGAFLQQNGSTLPNWVVTGTGRMLATDPRTDAKRIIEMKQLAASLVPTIAQPQDLFNDGTFSPGTIGAVGYTLVRFLVDSQGPAKFAQFVGQLQQGRSTPQALQQVYGADAQAIARGYIGSLGR